MVLVPPTPRRLPVLFRHFAAIGAAGVCSVEALADRHSRSRSALACGALRDTNT